MIDVKELVPSVSELSGVVGVIGGAIASAFGGFDKGLQILILLMGADYITGLIVAGIFHASPKTADGTLESYAGWKGLCRKGMTLLVVLIAAQLDGYLGSSFARDTVIIAYIVNELVSLIENAGLMGVPIPAVIKRMVSILKEKTDEKEVLPDEENH